MATTIAACARGRSRVNSARATNTGNAARAKRGNESSGTYFAGKNSGKADGGDAVQRVGRRQAAQAVGETERRRRRGTPRRDQVRRRHRSTRPPAARPASRGRGTGRKAAGARPAPPPRRARPTVKFGSMSRAPPLVLRLGEEQRLAEAQAEVGHPDQQALDDHEQVGDVGVGASQAPAAALEVVHGHRDRRAGRPCCA